MFVMFLTQLSTLFFINLVDSVFFINTIALQFLSGSGQASEPSPPSGASASVTWNLATLMVPNIRHHSVRGKAALGKAIECNVAEINQNMWSSRI